MNKTLQELYERKSVRVFEDREIESEKVDAILKAAANAPTAGCQQLYTIIKVTDQKLKEELAETCDHQPFIAKAKLVLVFLADCLKWYEAFQSAGCTPRKPEAGDLLLAVDDTMIAAQNAVVAAQSMGIGSCYIGDIMENREKVKELLHLPEYVFPAAMLVFGYPTQQQMKRPKPQRADMEYIVHENGYHHMNREELRQLMLYNCETDKYEEWMQAFCDRKFNSAFAREMSRSVSEYLREYAQEDTWEIPYTSNEEVITNRHDEITDDAQLVWKKVREEHLVRDEWIDFRRVAYQLPDGSVFSPYYNYSRRSYVVILATDTDGNVLCVRQYRHGIEKVTTEFPAGGIETEDKHTYVTAGSRQVKSETALETAMRELREETGYESDEWTHLITVPSNATVADNYAYVYVARNCKKVSGVNLDGTEFLNVILHTPDEIDQMIKAEKFDQAIHVMAWELAKNR